MSVSNKFDWKNNPELVERLRALWAEGVSVAEIGRRLGFSKNSIVGKAHRLGLPSRPSPIKHGGPSPRRSRPQRVRGPSLPKLASIAAPVPQPPPPIIAQPVRMALPKPRSSWRITPCCWPMSAPGTRDFRFCDSASVPNKPYCEQHCSVAFIPAPRRDASL
jgi:GcrA cell cycle regulator